MLTLPRQRGRRHEKYLDQHVVLVLMWAALLFTFYLIWQKSAM